MSYDTHFFSNMKKIILTLVSTYIILYTIRLIKIKHVNSGKITAFFVVAKIDSSAIALVWWTRWSGWEGPVRQHLNWTQISARVSRTFFLPHTYLCSEAGELIGVWCVSIGLVPFGLRVPVLRHHPNVQDLGVSTRLSESMGKKTEECKLKKTETLQWCKWTVYQQVWLTYGQFRANVNLTMEKINKTRFGHIHNAEIAHMCHMWFH